MSNNRESLSSPSEVQGSSRELEILAFTIALNKFVASNTVTSCTVKRPV